MGTEGHFVDEHGQGIDLDGKSGGEVAWIPDLTSTLAAAAAVNCELRVLGFIDPHGNTVINRLQAECVSGDIDRILAALPTLSDAERRDLERLRQVARACSEQVHTYIEFIGD